jgi:hypothetical protein
MARPWDDRQKDLLCPALDQIIDLGHSLVRLADAIDWRSSTDAIRESLSVTQKTGAIETKGLQTTAVFAPRDDQAMPSDTPDAQQISVAALTSTMRAVRWTELSPD